MLGREFKKEQRFQAAINELRAEWEDEVALVPRRWLAATMKKLVEQGTLTKRLRSPLIRT